VPAHIPAEVQPHVGPGAAARTAAAVVGRGLLEQRLLLRLPMPPALGGLFVAVLAFALSGLPNLLYHEAFVQASALTPVEARQGYFTDEGTWTALVWSLLLGYVLAAMTVLPLRSVADTLRTLDHLPADLADPERFVGLTAETVRRSRRAGLVWAALGTLGLLRTAWLLLAPASVAEFVLPFLVRFAWFIVVVPCTCFLIGRAAYVSLRTSRAGERDMLNALRFHVLDPSPFDGLVRMTLRTATAWIGGATLISLFLFNVPWRYLGATIPLALASCAMAAAVVWTPLVGVNRRMRALKQAELVRVLVEIERDRALLAAVPGPDGAGAVAGPEVAPRLAALLAYREAVKAAPEWPIDISNGGRILLLTVLPVLGWICAALVERGLGKVLSLD
jgi:hypothetical protein